MCINVLILEMGKPRFIKVKSFPKPMQLVRNRAGIQIQVGFAPQPHSFYIMTPRAASSKDTKKERTVVPGISKYRDRNRCS